MTKNGITRTSYRPAPAAGKATLSEVVRRIRPADGDLLGPRRRHVEREVVAREVQRVERAREAERRIDDGSSIELPAPAHGRDRATRARHGCLGAALLEGECQRG